MKSLHRGLLAAAASFVCGVIAASVFMSVAERPTAKATTTSAAVAPATTTTSETVTPMPSPSAEPAIPVLVVDELGRTPELEEWKNQHNGLRLPVSAEALADEKWAEFTKVLPTTSGKIFVSAGGTLYRFDARGRVEWKYTESQVIFDFVYVEATGLIYGLAFDNTMFILEAASGKRLVRNSRNGRAGYGSVAVYGNDQCLITDELSGYRVYETAMPPVMDRIAAWRGTRKLWEQDFPPDAQLVVLGEKIYAVTVTKQNVLFKEIKVPRR